MSRQEKTADAEKLSMGKRVGALAFRWRRRLATAFAVVVAVFLGYHVMFGHNGWTVYQQKLLEDRTLTRRIRDLQEENSHLKAHVERLEKSPDAIEHEAREKLHYTRPGEVIYTLEDKPTASAIPADKTSTDGRPGSGKLVNDQPAGERSAPVSNPYQLPRE